MDKIKPPLSDIETRKFLQRRIESDPAILAALELLKRHPLLLDDNFTEAVEKLTNQFPPETAKLIVEYHNDLVITKAKSQSRTPKLPDLSLGVQSGTLVSLDSRGRVKTGNGTSSTQPLLPKE